MIFEDKIYVAGHTGLVGSALWKNLLTKGYNNLVGKTIDELDLMDTRAVNTFFAEEKPEYVILAAAKVGGIVANNTYRGQFIYENLMIQNNVIHASYIHKVKKLLFLGSTCIYPRDAPQPMPEDCLLTSPLEYTNEPYAIAKIAGVKMCESYNLQYGTNFISVMPTNLYGPNDNFDLEKSHVLPGLLRKVHLGKCLQEGNWEAIREDLNRRPIEGRTGAEDGKTEGWRDGENGEKEKMRSWENEKAIINILDKYGIRVNSSESVKSISVEIWGTGTPMREFLWSEEMADACVYLMEQVDFGDLRGPSTALRDRLVPLAVAERSRSVSPEVRNTHINIGTGKEISIKDLALLIKEKVGFNGELVFNTSKPDGTMRKLTDPSKIHSLGWHHKIEIGEGIEKLYRWYLKN
ncbi:MAG TPA: GDP-L-fucose synthase [Prolixibacteraceae bacterium]